MDIFEIGETVRRKRKEHGSTQHRLAQLSGMSRTRINQIESGQAFDMKLGSIEKDLFKRVAEFSGNRRKANLEALFRLCVTNFAIRNGDAHLKNFALLFEDAESGPFTLSPAYDLVTTAAWIRTDMMALNHQGSKRWPKPQAVLQLGARARLSRQRAREIVAEVGEGVRTVMPDMLAVFEAHGQAVIGRSIATAWNEGLTTSLGVDPAPLSEPGKPSRGGDAEEDWSPPEPSPFASADDPFAT